MDSMRGALIFTYLLCGLLGGCGSESDSSTDHMHPQNGHTASHVDTYFDGIEKTSANGLFRVRLETSDPIPNYVGLHTWTIRILGGDGRPVEGAVLRAEPLMLAHGHGTNPQFTEGIENMADSSEFIVPDLDLFMPGVWTVTLTIETLDGRLDTVEFAFDLAG